MHVLIARRLIGFHVIPLRELFWASGVVLALCIFNRLLVDQIALRYGCNAVLLIVFALFLYRMALRDGINILALVKDKLSKS